MCTSYSTLSRFTYLIVLLSLGAGLLGSCNRAQQLGMKDNPQEILNHELNAPEAVLTPNQSITLLNHCAELGEQNAARAAKKTVSIFAGNTGAGKSTTLNALLGCQMKAVKPSELGLPGLKRVVVVDPESPRKEVMPIGHTHRSYPILNIPIGPTATALDFQTTEVPRSTSPMPSTSRGSCNKQPGSRLCS
jgi:hypothetical protein